MPVKMAELFMHRHFSLRSEYLCILPRMNMSLLGLQSSIYSSSSNLFSMQFYLKGQAEREKKRACLAQGIYNSLLHLEEGLE